MESADIIHGDTVHTAVDLLSDIIVQAVLLCRKIVVDNIILRNTFGLDILFHLIFSKNEIGRQFRHFGKKFVHCSNRFFELVCLAADVSQHVIIFIFFCRAHIVAISTVCQCLTLPDGLENQRAHTATKIIIEHIHYRRFFRIIRVGISDPSRF